MKTYRLQKAYPGSLEVGTEVKWGNNGLSGECYEARVKAGIFRFRKDIIENNPEFWQEVEQLDYEILTFSDNVTKGVLYEKQPSGRYGKGGFSTEDCLVKYGNSIHSVKRLSDGVVFTVGDCVVTKNVLIPEIITGFRINDGKTSFKKGIWVTVKNGGMHLDRIKEIRRPILTTEDGVPVYSYDSVQHWVINGNYEYALGLHKPNVDLLRDEPNTYKVFSIENAARDYVRKNTPIFVTEDGVKIFEGGDYHYVDTDFSITKVKALHGCGQYTERKYFFSFTEAQKYVNRTQPRLSIEDCLNIREEWHSNRLGLEESIREYLKKHNK